MKSDWKEEKTKCVETGETTGKKCQEKPYPPPRPSPQKAGGLGLVVQISKLYHSDVKMLQVLVYLNGGGIVLLEPASFHRS